LFGKRISRSAVGWISVGTVALSTIIAGIVGFNFIKVPPESGFWSQTLWTWFDVGGFAPTIGFHLDSLSLVMMLVVTFVGLLILIYSTAFMAGDSSRHSSEAEPDEGYSRFFAYMNLFIGSMLILVLADNLVFLYLGWEGVGLCSYLLIGFWYKNSKNGFAAIKAFLVTRIGDAAMAVGLFLLLMAFGTLDIQSLAGQISQQPAGSKICTVAAALLLAGALGKSAQLPLQVWLPDAMAGPTPVSALIHAATMVTAGVYLIARTNFLFLQAPVVLSIVAVIGAITLLIAGLSALVQRDIKRVLAYSTISQIGYMFLALGVGAWSAAIFHFMVHAYFKSLLFLVAGVVISAVGDEHDIFKMGGLRQRVPMAFWTFLIGCASLSALPFATAGFYSKDKILLEEWASPMGGPILWAVGLLGSFITSLYSFRVLFVVFFGEMKTQVAYKPAFRISFVLIVLAILSTTGGFIKLPYLVETFKIALKAKYILEIIAGLASLVGVIVAYVLFGSRRKLAPLLFNSEFCETIRQLWCADWGFDWLYRTILIRPYQWLAYFNSGDFIDNIYDGVSSVCQTCNRILSGSVTGNVRWYVAGLVIGSIIIIGFVILV
jgi:NADH-quinone oxidoreductase subunit L